MFGPLRLNVTQNLATLSQIKWSPITNVHFEDFLLTETHFHLGQHVSIFLVQSCTLTNLLSWLFAVAINHSYLAVHLLRNFSSNVRKLFVSTLYVPNKALFCHIRSHDCRARLLTRFDQLLCLLFFALCNVLVLQVSPVQISKTFSLVDYCE